MYHLKKKIFIISCFLRLGRYRRSNSSLMLVKPNRRYYYGIGRMKELGGVGKKYSNEIQMDDKIHIRLQSNKNIVFCQKAFINNQLQ